MNNFLLCHLPLQCTERPVIKGSQSRRTTRQPFFTIFVPPCIRYSTLLITLRPGPSPSTMMNIPSLLESLVTRVASVPALALQIVGAIKHGFFLSYPAFPLGAEPEWETSSTRLPLGTNPNWSSGREGQTHNSPGGFNQQHFSYTDSFFGSRSFEPNSQTATLQDTTSTFDDLLQQFPQQHAMDTLVYQLAYEPLQWMLPSNRQVPPRPFSCCWLMSGFQHSDNRNTIKPVRS
jgi:hypothetical protein